MKFLKNTVCAVLLSAAPLAACAQAETAGAMPTGSLAVTVTHIRNTEGKLMLAVYDREAAYNAADDGVAVASLALRPVGDKASVSIGMLPPGDYAVMLFHDENGNGYFDYKGEIPKEGYGISGAKHALDEPNFAKAAVKVEGGAKAVTVKLYYFK